jgi:hypothetical protein
MKKKRTAQSAPARSSLGEGGFLNLRVWLGFLAVICGVFLALFGTSALGRISPSEAKPQASMNIPSGVIGDELAASRAEGGPCQYTITYGTHTIVPGITDTGNHCVWCDTTINLPFPFVLYDHTFNTVMVNSSGRLDFVCNNEPSNYTETCLPAPPNNCPYDYTIFALWYEWATLTYPPGCSTWANGCGIFTSISGSAPNRIFNIEWHVVNRENSVETANFEVRLYENDPNKRFDVIYGSITEGLNTRFDSAGVQGSTGFFTSDFCNVPPPQNASSTYTMTPCASPTPTATPTTRVTNTNDSGPGSLRQALADANNGDTINFDPALNGRNISLTSAELVVDKNVTIHGPGQNLLGVFRSSNAGFRIFHVRPNSTVAIAGLTISGGAAGDQQGGGGILNDHATLTIDSCAVQNSFAEYGGGVYNDGSAGNSTLTVFDSTVSSNFASAGGGIFNDAANSGTATLSLTNSTVNTNTAAYNGFPTGGGAGGGIYNSGGTLMISNSVVTNNHAGVSDPFALGYGGGIINDGTVAITNSTISSNQAYQSGGGIDNAGTLTITSSTVSGNRADGGHDGQPWGDGGGISGEVTFTNSTLSGNYASRSGGALDGGGAITNSTVSNNGGGISVTGTLEIGNTILKAGPSGSNISNNGGTVTSNGYNISSDDGGGLLNGPGDQINTDPMLGPLQDNGGPTLTHALLPGSPAINTGDPNFTPPPAYDQRGSPFVRVFNGRIDIGSFEVQPPRRPNPAPRSPPTPRPRP